jgi:hypothetical protein
MKISWKLSVLFGSALLGFPLPCLAVDADVGAKVYADACTPCHTEKMRPLDKTHMTREQWKESIDLMIAHGVEVPKGKIPALLDYLIRTHGPVGTPAGAGEK